MILYQQIKKWSQEDGFSSNEEIGRITPIITPIETSLTPIDLH